jgi:hypothetical protein
MTKCSSSQLQIDLGQPLRHRDIGALPGWGMCGRRGPTARSWEQVTCPHCHSLAGCLAELRSKGEQGPPRRER